MILFTAFVFALAGGAWRWADGRGIPPHTWMRTVACAVLALLAVAPLGWWQAPLAAAMLTAVWVFRQKDREVYEDMLLRWLLPLCLIGAVLGLLGAWKAAPLVFVLVGAAVTTLVWFGARHESPFKNHPWLDMAALTEAPCGALVFGAAAYVSWRGVF